MPVAGTALSKILLVGRILLSIKHFGVISVASDLVPAQIGEVAGQRCRSEARTVLSDHPRAYHHAAQTGAQGRRHGSTPVAAKTGARTAPRAAAKTSTGVTGFSRGTHHLADKGLVADPAGTRRQIVITAGHGKSARSKRRRTKV